MFENSDAFSGMSSNGTEASRRFHEGVLGLEVTDEGMGGLISVRLPKGDIAWFKDPAGNILSVLSV